jgi:hypothetical protein
MQKKIGRLGIAALMVVILLFAVIWLTLFDSEVGMARIIDL